MSEERRLKIDEQETKGNWKKAAELWRDQAIESTDAKAKVLSYLKAANNFTKIPNDIRSTENAAIDYRSALEVAQKNNLTDLTKEIIEISTKYLEDCLKRSEYNWTANSHTEAELYLTLTAMYEAANNKGKMGENAGKAANLLQDSGKAILEPYTKNKVGKTETRAIDDLLKAQILWKKANKTAEITNLHKFLFHNTVSRFDVETFSTVKEGINTFLSTDGKKDQISLEFDFFKDGIELMLSSVKDPQAKPKKDQLEAISIIAQAILPWGTHAFDNKVSQNDIVKMIANMATVTANNFLDAAENYAKTLANLHAKTGNLTEAAKTLHDLAKKFLQANSLQIGKNFTNSAADYYSQAKMKNDAAKVYLDAAIILEQRSIFDDYVAYSRKAEEFTQEESIKNEIESHLLNSLHLTVSKNNQTVSDMLVSEIVKLYTQRKKLDKLPGFYLEVAKIYPEIEKKIQYLNLAYDTSVKSKPEISEKLYNYIDSCVAEPKTASANVIQFLLTYKALKQKDKKLSEGIDYILGKIPSFLTNNTIPDVMKLKEQLVSETKILKEDELTAKILSSIATSFIKINRRDIGLPLLKESYESYKEQESLDRAKEIIEIWATCIQSMINNKKENELRQEYLNHLLAAIDSLNWPIKKAEVMFIESKEKITAGAYEDGIKNLETTIEYLTNVDDSEPNKLVLGEDVANFTNDWGKTLAERKKKDISLRLFDVAELALTKISDYESVARLIYTQTNFMAQRKEKELALSRIDKAISLCLSQQNGALAGELMEMLAGDFMRYFHDNSALDLYQKAARLYKDAQANERGAQIGRIVEQHAMTFSKEKKGQGVELYQLYFNAAAKIYEDFQLSEGLGDLYSSELRRILDQGTPDEILEAARKASKAYTESGSDKGAKAVDIVNNLKRCNNALLRKREYTKVAELINEGYGMLVNAKEHIKASDFLKDEALSLIDAGAVDSGIGLLEQAAESYSKQNKKIEAGKALFEGAKRLSSMHFDLSISSISKSVTLLEDAHANDEIKKVADDCVLLANKLTQQGNEYAARLYIEKSVEIYNSGIISEDHSTDQVYSDYSMNLLDQMQTSVRHSTGKKRRRKKGSET